MAKAEIEVRVLTQEQLNELSHWTNQVAQEERRIAGATDRLREAKEKLGELTSGS